RSIPGAPIGLNTDNPAAPSARYRTKARKARRLPSVNPTRSTAKFCRLRGTGVPGIGSEKRAHTAMNKLAATTMATCRAASSDLLRGTATPVGIDIRSPLVLPLTFGFRGVFQVRMLVLGLLQAVSHLHVRRQCSPQDSPSGDGDDQEPPEHPHDDSGYQKQSAFRSEYSSQRDVASFVYCTSSIVIVAPPMEASAASTLRALCESLAIQ